MPVRAASLLVAFAAAATAQTVLYVDARSGVDRPGGGTPNAPLKTLTFAASQATGPTTFRLRPGTYDQAGGEAFPIAFTDSCTIEADPAQVPPRAGVVEVASSLALTTTLAFDLARGGTVVVKDLVFSGGMFRALRMDVAPATRASLVVQRCRISQSRCVVMNVAAGGAGTLAIDDTDLSGPDTPITVAAGAGSVANLIVDRSVVLGGLRAGLYLDASAGGGIAARLRASRVGGAQTRGIAALTDLGGFVSTRIEHCLLHDVGSRTIGGTVGAIMDIVGGTGLPPQHTVVNSILHHNRSDAPGGTGVGYAWGANLVSQGSLVGVGGNLAGTATFADEGRSDYHLAPTSAGIDGGLAADRTGPADLDGDPYLDAQPDLGPDEVHFAYVAGNRVATLGSQYTLRPLVAPNAAFAVLLASDRVPGSFGPGTFHLAGVVVDPGLTGLCDARGVGQATLAVPGSAALHLRTVHWQAGTPLAPILGANARSTVLRAP